MKLMSWSCAKAMTGTFVLGLFLALMTGFVGLTTKSQFFTLGFFHTLSGAFIGPLLFYVLWLFFLHSSNEE